MRRVVTTVAFRHHCIVLGTRLLANDSDGIRLARAEEDLRLGDQVISSRDDFEMSSEFEKKHVRLEHAAPPVLDRKSSYEFAVQNYRWFLLTMYGLRASRSALAVKGKNERSDYALFVEAVATRNHSVSSLRERDKVSYYYQ